MDALLQRLLRFRFALVHSRENCFNLSTYLLEDALNWNIHKLEYSLLSSSVSSPFPSCLPIYLPTVYTYTIISYVYIQTYTSFFIGSKRHGSWSASTEEQFLTRNLEWSLHVCILNDMFNEKFTLRRDFLYDEAALRRRFMMAGLVQLALMPFLLVFMVMQFFLQVGMFCINGTHFYSLSIPITTYQPTNQPNYLPTYIQTHIPPQNDAQNAQEWQQKKNYLGPRQWSPLAQWKFREYNEVPHLFERRLNASYPFAMQYTRQCPRPVAAVLARCCAYISGSVVAVLLLFTLLDESILLYVKLWDRNLLWYVVVTVLLDFLRQRSERER